MRVDAVALGPGGRVRDLGGGTGRTTLTVARLRGAQGRCIGIAEAGFEHLRTQTRMRKSVAVVAVLARVRACGVTSHRGGDGYEALEAEARHGDPEEHRHAIHAAPGGAGWLVGWEMALRSSNRQRNMWAVGLLEVEPTDRVLEIGFGPGIAIRELSRQATHGLVCGVDHSAVMVRHATRRNAAAVRAGRVELRLGAAEQLPAFPEPFDKVLVVNNLGMWRTPDAQLKEIYRRMRSGGRIAIVSQPRCPGATAETTLAAGREIVARLTAAGFTGIRSDTLALKPPVICVLGEVP